MKQNASGQPSTVEPEIKDLNPHLQKALSCLDIKLEDELARFRQQQSQESVQVNEETWLQAAPMRDTDSSILSAEIVRPKDSQTILEPGEYEVLPPSEGFEVLDRQSAAYHPQPSPTIDNYATVVNDGEDIALPPEELDLNFSPGGAIAPFQHEYLASSQELLRQIEAEEPTPPASATVPTPPKRKLFTPLRVGSVAAMCLVAGGAAYTYLNPNFLTTLTGAKVATVAPTNGPNLGQSIQSPNLAANDFTEINLSNLNTIKVNATASTTNVTQTASTTNATAANPVAVPYTPVNPKTIVPTAIVQPKLADSLVKSLLPGNFQQLAQEYQKMRTASPGGKKAPN
jgi:hypothetical protein